ncbi:MAG: transcription elongation factor GreA [Candidatus Omnitrophota bacterium]|nr:transcription elongation factor GreA [Candidatus Omnitrophota bacterium]
MGETYLTKAGLEKLHAEQKGLLRQKRELTEEVSRAAAMGDLRENSEYHAARERLQHVAKRLVELDEKLTHVRLIDGLEVKAGEARVGVQVTLEDAQTKERFGYLLVGDEEADPQHGTLSIASPLGKALLGKKPGEQVTLTLPRGAAHYRLVTVERPRG